ncbi:unnamed protein product [Moneuplotes crassus]|uniref:Uncharacterized protein n=1 Tax=Euplotes crassus TaxID=5936 RepID=A0AAD1Y6L8_EUPCR|nr:unnamed protein product [Moneuplotes crassus]
MSLQNSLSNSKHKNRVSPGSSRPKKQILSETMTSIEAFSCFSKISKEEEQKKYQRRMKNSTQYIKKTSSNDLIHKNNNSFDGKSFIKKKYSLYKKKSGLSFSSPMKNKKAPKCMKNFSSGSNLKMAKNGKIISAEIDNLRSVYKKREKLPSSVADLTKTKLKKEKSKTKKSLLKDNNCTTAETNTSEPAKFTIKGSHGTLQTQKLKVKKTLCKSVSKKRGIAEVRTLRKSLSPQNMFQRHININENVGHGVSTKFISLIEEDDQNFVKMDESHPVNKPRAIQLINDATKGLSSTRKKLNTLKLADHSHNIPREDSGEENYEESPCNQINIPQTKSLQTSSEKYKNPIKNFTIIPRLISGKLEDSLICSKPKQSCISNARCHEDEDYQLFSWSNEFDDILNETHQEVNQGCPEIRQIEISDCKEMSPMLQYTILQQFMSAKSDTIREINKKVYHPEIMQDKALWKQKRRSASYIRKTFSDRAFDAKVRSISKNPNPSCYKKNLRKLASDVTDSNHPYNFFGNKTLCRKYSEDYNQEKLKTKFDPWSNLIGYIDYLGIFHCNVDPKGENWYIKQEIEPDGHILSTIFSRDGVAEWRKDVANAWEILRPVYQGLRWFRESQEIQTERRYKMNKEYDSGASSKIRLQMLILPIPERVLTNLHLSIPHIGITSLNNPLIVLNQN